MSAEIYATFPQLNLLQERLFRTAARMMRIGLLTVILAYYDPDSALERLETRFDEVQNNNELFNLYYLLNSIKTYNNHTKDIKTANGVSASVYKVSENEYRAICFNGTNKDKEYVFLNEKN